MTVWPRAWPERKRSIASGASAGGISVDGDAELARGGEVGEGFRFGPAGVVDEVDAVDLAGAQGVGVGGVVGADVPAAGLEQAGQGPGVVAGTGVITTLAEFRRRGLPGDPAAFSRYSYVHARVLLDRLDGEIATILDRKRTLDPDAYVNQTYRSLKSYRDGRDAMGHLDAAESMPYALEVPFALHRRVRPYIKHLQWELERQPLGDGEGDDLRLLLPPQP